MSARNILMAAAGSADDKLYVDDVFSAYLYTGNGSTQTINNGIDLAGKGGLVWTKCREGSAHRLQDTASTPGRSLSTNSTASQNDDSFYFSGFATSGYTLINGNTNTDYNYSGKTYVSWTFRKAPKFFDVVTFNVPSVSDANRRISHSLGITPGMVIVKKTNNSDDWWVWHRNISNANNTLRLNTNVAEQGLISPWGPGHTATDFGINDYQLALTGTYVAYLFAHDPSADGIVQCGSVTGTGAVSVNLGWEPQYVLIKCSTDGTSDWEIFDTARGMPVDNTLSGGSSGAAGDRRLCPNSSAAEDGFYAIEPTATGFSYIKFGSPATFVYLAIRRPNKPPTTGTQVYNAVARTGTGATPVNVDAGLAPDMVSIFTRDGGQNTTWVTKLAGKEKQLTTPSNVAEVGGYSGITQFGPTGVTVYDAPGAADMNQLGFNYVNHFFRRAPGFFDVVCYTGTGVAKTVEHNLGAAPELIILKSRSAATQWGVWHSALAATEKLVLNSNAAKATDATAWNSTLPGALSFTVGTGGNVNASSATFVTYLFATLPGISKVGSYTGNGSSQAINCGFSTGARFVLIKRTDSTGDWYVWDSVRGIVAANDPHLSLNTSAAEVTTDDSVDPDSSGFIVNQVAATNINVSGGTYIFLAIA